MSSSSHTTPARIRKPCRLYSQGHCRFGDKCWFSHDADVPTAGSDAHLDHPHQSCAGDHTPDSVPPSSHLPSPHETSDVRPRPKRGETTCRAWRAGTCTRGSKCWFSHAVDVQRPGLEPSQSQSHEQKRSSVSLVHPTEDSLAISPLAATAPSRAEKTSRKSQFIQEQEAEAAIAAREREHAVAREEAAKTITQVIQGSIVTYSAGLDVPNLITGFETCTLRIRNLPLDVKEDDIHGLLNNQRLDVNYFHLTTKKGSDRKIAAHIVTNIASGRALASVLDGAEFQEETLVVEMSATNSLEGMNTGSGQGSEILTISWRVPSACYIAEYIDIAAANSKVRELDRFVYCGRRIKVQMNSQPRGRYVPSLRLNAIKINNLPPSVTDLDVMRLTNSTTVKRLVAGGTFSNLDTVEYVARLVRDDIDRAVPRGLKKFDDPADTCSMEGIAFARAHFSSWDEAHTAYTHLENKRYGYGSQTVWLRLPDPMYFTLVIPMEQYRAQRAQWDSLSNSIKDKKACTLNVRETGNIVRIRLSGSVKEATGALKVRVENLARGEKVEGWHRSFGFPGNPFILRVYSETDAYLRADWKRKSLKVYGAPSAADQARGMIRAELERLASLDYTITLAQNSVGFFVREGIQQLKDTLGENNVRFAMSSRKLTVSGGEEARHALDRLITLSLQGNHGLADSQDDQTCPICYDNVSSPHRLGCGHAYCVACLRHFISSAVESDQLPLACLGDEAQCHVPIAIPTIQQFVPPASFNRLLEAAFDVYIAKHPEEFKPCKTPDCTQIYRASRTGAATPQTLHCPSCFSAVCNGCHEDAHEGLTCAQNKARDPAEQEWLIDNWITSQGGRVKKCPQCSVPIEKLEGCNHMTCRCGAHICWRCMGVFTSGTIYPHMSTVHGTIHGDEQVAAVQPPLADDIGFVVDIEQQRELLRQAEMRRNAALRNLGAHRAWDDDYVAPWAPARVGEQERRQEERRRRRQELEQQREAAERRRAEQAQQQERGGWGCTVM